MDVKNLDSKVAAVILNYNSWEDTERCVVDLEEQSNVNLSIIVVDNCSPNKAEKNHLKYLKEQHSIKLIFADTNRGYNAGNNIGIEYAIKSGADYVLIANPDMRFEDKGYVSKLLKSFTNSSIVVVGSDIITPEGCHQNPMTTAEFGWKDNFSWITDLIFKKKANPSQWNDSPEKSRFCTSLNGCCLLIRSSFLNKIGNFEDRVFLFGEERILGSQVQSYGLKMYYDGSVRALHNHIKHKEGNQWARLKLLKHSDFIYFKHYDSIPFLIKPLLWCLIQLKYLLLYCKYH